MSMNKKTIIISIVISVLFIVGSIITLVLANSGTSNADIQKTDSQILYLENEIISITNQLNNISLDNYDNTILNRDQKINWDNIEHDILKLYSSWNTIIIDFNNLNIKNINLTNFGKKLDDITIAIKNKDKISTFNNLCELYSFLITYLESYDSNEELKNNMITKYYLLKACSLVDTNNWTLIYENIINAEKSYYNNINSITIANKNNQLKRNKIYVSIKELENIIQIKDIDLFYFKYILVMKNF